MPNDEPTGTQVATVPGPDFSNVPATQNSRAVFLPANLGQAMELAHFMAGGIGVRQWMRGNPSACLALIQISMRWGMDPYIVANKAYYTNDTLAFESQLVNAVINTSGAIVGRLKVEFAGDTEGAQGKETLNCRVSGRLHADPDQVFVHEQPLCRVTIRNSPLWKVNPKQQLQYHATRAWARLYIPEVLLGIYTPDEIADGAAEKLEAQSLPRDATPAPDRRQFQEAAEDAEVEAIVEEGGTGTTLPEIEPGDENEERTDEALDSPDTVEQGTVEQREAADTAAPVQQGVGAAADALPAGQSGPAVEHHSEDRPVPDPDIPVEPLEWSAWEREKLAELEKLPDMPAFNEWRAAIQPALDQADDDLLNRMQDAIGDKVVTLTEKKA